MSIKNKEVQLVQYSIDIRKSMSMMAKIAIQPQWKILEKQEGQMPILIRWVAELNDVNLNNEIGKFISHQIYFITIENTDLLIKEVATIFIDSGINAQKLFVLESKKRNFKLPKWDEYSVPDEYMTDVLTELKGELPQNPAS